MSDSKTTRTFKDAVYEHLATVGKALSSSTRLEILEVLSQAPRTVESIAGQVDQSVANTSHHLQALKRARLVTSTRDGLYVIYSLSGDDVAALLGQLNEVASQHIDDLEQLCRAFFDAREGLEAIGKETLLERLREGEVVLIDVRPEEEYDSGHLPGALSVPVEALEARIADLPRDRTIVAYCRGPYCALSAEAVKRLREEGFEALRTEVSVSDWSDESTSGVSGL